MNEVPDKQLLEDAATELNIDPSFIEKRLVCNTINLRDDSLRVHGRANHLYERYSAYQSSSSH